MEDTVGTQMNYSYKGQPLRVNYKGQEYQFQILQKGIRKEDTEISILLDGSVQRLLLSNGGWCFAGSDEDKALAQEIYRAISLRYRI